MLHIMDYLRAPKCTNCVIEGTYLDSSDGLTKQCKTEKLHCILFGGDQLTVARATGCQRIGCDSIVPRDSLEGLQPACD